MHCADCGIELPAGASFCPGCGKRLVDTGAGMPMAPAGADPAGHPAPNSTAEHLQMKATQLRHVPDIVEQEQWRGHYSAKAMYGPMIICGVITLVAVILLLVVPAAWMKWTIVGATALMWLWILLQIAQRQIGIRYRLTNQRFFVERGVLRRVTDRIEVIDINDMKFEQGVFDRMFNVGTITITSSDHSLPEVTLEGIEHVAEVANLIDQARRAERNRRGVYIETS